MDATTAEESFATILGNGSSWMSKKFNDFDFSFGRHLFCVRCSAAALPDLTASNFQRRLKMETYLQFCLFGDQYKDTNLSFKDPVIFKTYLKTT